MSITSEIEILASLRDRGDLTQAEFEKAKTLMLSSGESESRSPDDVPPTPLMTKSAEKKKKTQLLIAILSTVTAVLTSISAVIATSPIKLLIFALFTAAAILNWIVYLKNQSKDNK